MRTRVLSLFFIIGISIGVSFVVNSWMSTISAFSNNKSCNEGETKPLISLGNYGTSSNDEREGCQCQMTNANPKDVSEYPSGKISCSDDSVGASYEYLTDGRPTPRTFLSSLDDAANPGIFMCGPKLMMQDIRKAAHSYRGCCVGTRLDSDADSCEEGEDRSYTIYEEVFET